MALRLAVLAGAAGLAWMVAMRWTAWVGAAAVETTNAAYLAADLTPMSARVAGIVRDVPVRDFQAVRAGDLLAQIAEDDYRARVHQAEADLAAAEAQLANAQAQRGLQRANIAAAMAAVEGMRAALERTGHRPSASAAYSPPVSLARGNASSRPTRLSRRTGPTWSAAKPRCAPPGPTRHP